MYAEEINFLKFLKNNAVGAKFDLKIIKKYFHRHGSF